MWQEAIAYTIVAAAVIYLAAAIVRRLSGKAKDPCSGCGGCDLRDEFRKKQTGCGKGRREDTPGCGKGRRGDTSGCGCK